MQTVLWSRIEGNGLEYCEIHTQPVTTLRRRVVTQLDGKPLSVSYSVQCEDDGATPQRYTCVDPTAYLYESIKSGYRAKISVDPDGVVIVYQGEWNRV
ncbi:putative glycolipid-binding domain-containing protein [Alicyclobacillus pomorum]|uniref:putative glycolipid-binding domain-containing protein n=1 Tax=Alicyclobacillus pomorum TaxID=204470 RepID=UPI0004792D63|nr:putative glycolipid-binding domain-containing protein [Alicyclobacillus pomorum]